MTMSAAQKKPARGRKMPAQPKFKRIVLKLSGEALRGEKTGETIDNDILRRVCRQIMEVQKMGVQVCVVVGGGNIFRGLPAQKNRGMDRATGDYMGMLATVINGMAIMDCLEGMGAHVRVLTAIPMEKVAEPFILRRALRHLQKGRIVVFVAGTGNPYFSTDTCAALRASEMSADCILKATNVDGVYNKDPRKFKDAVRYKQLGFVDALRERLNVMDSTAFSLCLDNCIPIKVFDLNAKDSIQRAVTCDDIGTLVHC